jgi:tetratricopeptide (TPR) repeat protein
MRKTILLLLITLSFNGYSQMAGEYQRNLNKDSLLFQKANEYTRSACFKNSHKDYRGAISDINKTIELQPNDIQAYEIRAIAKKNLQDYRGAIVDYTKAIQLHESEYNELGIFNTTNFDIARRYNNRAICKEELKDYRGAIADYNKAIDNQPDDYSYYINRGLIKDLTGDKNGACLDWSKAGELGSERAYELIKDYCN